MYPIPFRSAASVFVSYLLIRAAPITALVFYFSNWQYTLIAAGLLSTIVLIYALRSNHHFTLHAEALIVTNIAKIGRKSWQFPYCQIENIRYQLSSEADPRQWLQIQTKDTVICFRCDWLHRQDPPEDEDDHHEQPEGELFELLEDEDFYKGSIEQLLDLLRNQKIDLQPF